MSWIRAFLTEGDPLAQAGGEGQQVRQVVLLKKATEEVSLGAHGVYDDLRWEVSALL